MVQDNENGSEEREEKELSIPANLLITMELWAVGIYGFSPAVKSAGEEGHGAMASILLVNRRSRRYTPLRALI